jgi:hypothetical protein
MIATSKADKFCAGLCYFFLFLGIFSRVFIYAKGENLWVEEALLWDKLKPLIGGCSEFALRFFPLLAGIATLFLGYIFALREFGVRFACVFLFLLVSSDPLLFYSVNFSFYGIEALLIVLCLCVWSFGDKKPAALIRLITITCIFCVICNYNPNDIGYSVRNYYIQMLGRHFINFHYLAFGIFVWINAFIFILPFCIGSFLLFKEKRALAVAILIAFSILIFPQGVPYSEFMRLMRNWSQIQVTGSKYLVFILPLVFIPVAFFIHKIFLKLRNPTLIPILCIFAFLATSSNFIRMHKGIGSPDSTAIIYRINEYAGTRSLVYVDSVSHPIFDYYNNADLNHVSVKSNGYMYLNDTVFIGKYSGRTEELFDIMKNFKAENGFFFFTFSSFHSIKESNKLIGYVQKNHEGKSKGFQARHAGAAWVRFSAK